MDTLTTQARDRLAAVIKEIQQLTSEKDELTEFLRLRDRVAQRFSGQQELPILPPLTIPPAPRQVQFAGGGPMLIPPWIARANGATMKERIIGSALHMLGMTAYVHTAQMLEAMEAAGIVITGYDKKQTISSLLSRDDRFKSDRRLGWSLNKQATGTVSAVPMAPVAPAM